MVPPSTQEFETHSWFSPLLYSPHPLSFVSAASLHSHGLCLLSELLNLVDYHNQRSRWSPPLQTNLPMATTVKSFKIPNLTIPLPPLEIRGTPLSSQNPNMLAWLTNLLGIQETASCFPASYRFPDQPYLQTVLRELFKNTDFPALVQRCWFIRGERGLTKFVFYGVPWELIN